MNAKVKGEASTNCGKHSRPIQRFANCFITLGAEMSGQLHFYVVSHKIPFLEVLLKTNL